MINDSNLISEANNKDQESFGSFVCPRCNGRMDSLENEDKSVELEEGRLEEVETFKYLEDELDSDGAVEVAVRGSEAAAWLKWRDNSSLLVNRVVPLEHRVRIYKVAMRPVLMYGSASWPLTNGLQKIVVRTDRRTMRYLAGVR